MATIRIVRNEAGNCINFYGASNPTYWNACLSGQVDPNKPDTVNIINDIITAQTGITQYEFYRIPYTDFVDAEGNAFATAQEAADYITEKANVIGLSGDGIDLIGQSVCFTLDATSTSILLDNGYSYGVNTIKAVEESGVISILSIDASDSITHFYNLEVGNACVNGQVVPGGVNDVVNVLNELFTVGAFESVVISDPFSTLVADVNGVPSGYTLEGSTVLDPVGDAIATNSSSGNYAGLLSEATIDQPGEYFTFDIQGEGQIGFGLVHTQQSYDDGYFSGSSVYADPTSFAVGNSAHYGFQFSHWFHPTPNGSWTNYGANTSYTQQPGWYSANTEFEARDEWLAGDPIKIRVGLDENGYIAIYSLKDDGTTWVKHVRTSYPATDGSEFRLGVKFANASSNVYSAPKVHRLDSANAPTTLGDQSISTFGTGLTGTISGGGVSAISIDGLANDGFISNQVINAVGEFYEFTWSGGPAWFGLFSENEYDLSDLTTSADADEDWTANGNAKLNDFVYYGAKALGSNGDITNKIGDLSYSGALNAGNGNYYGRVGFDSQGRASVWVSNDGGLSFTLFHHATTTAAAGDYKFIWIPANNGAVIESLEQGTIDVAPVMNFRYVESPDGVFQFPIFATLEEADYFIEQNGGTAGSGTTQLFPDDPTNTTWYLPYPYYNNNEPAAPVGETFLGNFVAYTEITTLTNAQLLPPAFSSATLTVNEFASVNYQTQPQDTGYTTVITNLPSGLTDLGGGIIGGTAPEVTGDNVANPSDDYTVTVTRTNSHGSSTGTLTITVVNLTAPVITAITGFTHNASSTALLSDDEMDSGSVVTMDEDLKDLERLVVLKSFVETNVLPSLQQAGDKYYMGVLNSGADISSVEDSDWDVAFVWEYQSATSHQYRVIKDGVQQHHTGIGSRTVALFDYAIEVHNGNVYMIACNQDAINTEPSPEYGGAFSNATEVLLGETAPLTISLAYVGSLSAKFAETGLSEIVTPLPDNWIQVTGNPSHVLNFDGSTTMPTLQAGYTYRFMMGDTQYADLSSPTGLHVDDDLRFTADGTTEYTTGITRVGNPNDLDTFGAHTAYVEFVVPSDVPPLQWYTDHNGIGSATGVNISGSTYVVTVTGITQEGPAINQTGTNLFNDPAVDADGVVWGWLSIDEQLSAGERLVLDNAFMVDLTDAMPDNSGIFIGLKSGTWTESYRNNSIANATYAGARFAIYRYSAADIRVFGYITGATTIGKNFGTNGILNKGLELAFEITNSGNNIRLLMRNTDDNSVDNANSTAYADWDSSEKTQTGDQGFGLTSLDIMVLGDGNVNASGANGAMDSADVDWTGLSEISIPTPSVSNLTSWSKALDFSGSSERAAQVTNDSNRIPMKMGGTNNQVSAPTAGQTVLSGHPWATVIVFNSDKNSSNQHIWNLGEGAGTTDDNIYLRTDSTGKLYFGWGRQGDLCEMLIHPAETGTGWTLTSGNWYGIYIAHNGTRYGSDNTTSLMADAFDIRLMGSSNNWATVNGSDTNLSVASDWTISGDGRMNRQYQGEMTIGGRGANRNFHGKVASFISTTLRVGVAMPTTAEIEMMITDPIKWLNDYKVGVDFRLPWGTNNAGFNFSLNDGSSAYSTQVWLMGDGTNDSYSNMIRNQVLPSDQNYTKLNLISMVSNDIENVTISGLSS